MFYFVYRVVFCISEPVEQQDSRAFQHVQQHSLKAPFSASSNLISFPPFDSSFTSAPVRCVQCGLEFYTLASYRWHMSHYHLRFNCSICGKAFRSRGGLGFHMEAHRGRNFVCPICEFRFKHKHHLKDHVTNVHKMMLCTVCCTFNTFESDLYNSHLKACKQNKRGAHNRWSFNFHIVLNIFLLSVFIDNGFYSLINNITILVLLFANQNSVK